MPRDRPPGIWESLKRALTGAEPPPAPPRPELPQVPTQAKPSLSAPPFLLPDPEEPDAIRGSETVSADTSEPRDPPAPSVPPPAPAPAEPEGPRLARGLASFSRSNADREKKFAHLLHDDTPGEKKKPPA